MSQGTTKYTDSGTTTRVSTNTEGVPCRLARIVVVIVIRSRPARSGWRPPAPRPIWARNRGRL